MSFVGFLGGILILGIGIIIGYLARLNVIAYKAGETYLTTMFSPLGPYKYYLWSFILVFSGLCSIYYSLGGKD